MGFNSYSKSKFINLLAGYNGLVETYNPIIFRDFMYILTLIYFHIETHVNLQIRAKLFMMHLRYYPIPLIPLMPLIPLTH